MKNITSELRKKELRLLMECVRKAEKLGLIYPPNTPFEKAVNVKWALLTVLDCVNQKIGLRLEKLLEADDFNFSHDIAGIFNNFNFDTQEIENDFLPRFSK